MKRFMNIVLLGFTVTSLALLGCGKSMDKESDKSHAESHTADVYTCPMHPSVQSDKPGACPICHMTLVKVTSDEAAQDTEPGHSGLSLSASRLVLANVATQSVERSNLIKTITAVGKMDIAEPNNQQITARYAGRVERLLVSFVGENVRQGQLVAEIYSPDAVAAQREYLVALENQPGITETSAETYSGANVLQQSKRKLKLWDFTDDQIDQLSKTREARTVVPIYSPVAGTVIRKNINAQAYISAGEALFDVANLQSLWLQFDLYEAELSAARIGLKVTATIDAFPGEQFQGTISFISPLVEPTTRTVRVRASVDNRGLKLKPEMFAQVLLHVPLPKTIVVPASAVMSTGKRTVVWVEASLRHFEPRAVVLGERAGDFYQVLEGLAEGEIIATTGSYLIDSESQLQMSNTHAGH
jgi:Cu(I)/Ag(I) efflux system membrane fusion protein